MGHRRRGQAEADAAHDQHRQHQQAAAPKYAFDHLCPPSEALPIWQVRDWYAHQTPEGSIDVTPEMQPNSTLPDVSSMNAATGFSPIADRWP